MGEDIGYCRICRDKHSSLCAVYTEEEYRCRGIAGRLLDFFCLAKGELPEGDYSIFKISPDLEQVAIIPAKFIRNNAEPSLCRTRSHQK